MLPRLTLFQALGKPGRLPQTGGRSQARGNPARAPSGREIWDLERVFMPTAVTITSDQRIVLYEEILACLTGVGDIEIAIDRSEFDKAQELAEEYADYLRVLADGLGWGMQKRGSVDLHTSPDVIQRVMKRLKRRASTEDSEIEAQEALIRIWQKRTALLGDTCDQLLAVEPSPSS